MRITSKGQVTIPQALREELGLMPGTQVDFELDGDGVRLRKSKSSHGTGRAIVENMSGRASSGMSTDELMAFLRD